MYTCSNCYLSIGEAQLHEAEPAQEKVAGESGYRQLTGPAPPAPSIYIHVNHSSPQSNRAPWTFSCSCNVHVRCAIYLSADIHV